MIKHQKVTLAAALVFLVACQASARKLADDRPKLVVGIVIDQMASWALESYLGYLDPAGAIRRSIQRGTYHHRVGYEYAATHTAPGHAAIFTGAAPLQSGVEGNYLWDENRKKKISVLDDGIHTIYGVKEEKASPKVLQADGVADILSREGKAKVVSLSMKHRGAVLPGGHHPDLVLWYEAEAKGFTTSDYYAKGVPSWYPAWSQRYPLSNYLGEWKAADPQRLEIALGADGQHGEMRKPSFRNDFPHFIGNDEDGLEDFRMTPASTEWMLELAYAAAVNMQLGTDAYPDLLAISVSSTDFCGHAFGPQSWEALDNFIRVDRALGQLLERLERRSTVAWFITSDHGVAPLPEVSERMGRPSGRISPKSLGQNVETELDRRLGNRDWVALSQYHSLTFNHAPEVATYRNKAVSIALEVLRKTPGLEMVVEAAEAKKWTQDADRVRRSIALSLTPSSTADIVMIPKPYFVLTDNIDGTSHGSPWFYDQEVPVLMAGIGVQRLETYERYNFRRMASTLAALLGVKPPRYAETVPLPGLVQ